MSRQSDAVVAALERETAKAAKALILEIDRELRRSPKEGGTPVDTGHARASWLPSIGAPAQGEGDEATHAAAVASVLRYQLDDGNLFLTNNAPYIGLLNLGASDQAELGFVEAAQDRALTTIQARFAVKIDVGVSSFTNDIGGAAAGNLASAFSPFGGDDE